MWVFLKGEKKCLCVKQTNKNQNPKQVFLYVYGTREAGKGKKYKY